MTDYCDYIWSQSSFAYSKCKKGVELKRQLGFLKLRYEHFFLDTKSIILINNGFCSTGLRVQEYVIKWRVVEVPYLINVSIFSFLHCNEQILNF